MAEGASLPSSRSLQAIAEIWPQFAAEIEARLTRGAIDYGDRSFDLPGPLLCDEIAQEIADICGWSFILRCRIERVKAALMAVDPPAFERMELRRYNEGTHGPSDISSTSGGHNGGIAP